MKFISRKFGSRISKLPVLIFLSLLYILSFERVYASENFDTSYNVIYDVKNDESTLVTLDIGLTNKSTNSYATTYRVQTIFDEISNVYVADPTGELDYKTEKNDKGTLISFEFNDRTVGLGNTQKVIIGFETNEIAKNYGSTWVVNIPNIANQDDFVYFNVQVKTPESFGKASIVKPDIRNKNSSDRQMLFTKEDLGKSGISIAYGDYQIYEFNLKYHIKNTNVVPKMTEIALPSDTNYQKVAIDTMNPAPDDVVIDKDGNWLARYSLRPSQEMTITVVGRAKVNHIPQKTQLSDEDKKIYLNAQKYWEANDSKIKELAKELKTPENIYNYVVSNLRYDTGRLTNEQVRAGARGVLKNPTSATCLEFTDLFVAIARSAGIPSRAVEGYANTTNSVERPLSLIEDVLHAWPQYWDDERSTWVMVDPTWGNTTKGIDYFNVFDFDHLSFVIKGERSDYPIPAGGYKITDVKSERDVSVKTIEDFETDHPALTVATDFSKNIYGGLPIEGNLIVTNDSTFISPPQTFSVSVEGMDPQSQNLYIDQIPPYGKKIIPIKFGPVNPLTNKIYEVKISIGQDILVKNLEVLPIYRSVYFAYFLGGILSGILVIIILFIAYRTRSLHFPK